jgi:hypothetical protein
MNPFFPSAATKERRKMAEQAKQAQQPTNNNQQPRKDPPPQIRTTFTAQEQEEIKNTKAAEMYDPTKRFIVMDSDSFSVMVTGLLQIRDSELTTAVLRRRQDFDK